MPYRLLCCRPTNRKIEHRNRCHPAKEHQMGMRMSDVRQRQPFDPAEEQLSTVEQARCCSHYHGRQCQLPDTVTGGLICKPLHRLQLHPIPPRDSCTAYQRMANPRIRFTRPTHPAVLRNLSVRPESGDSSIQRAAFGPNQKS